jgi:hypothetical protein
VATINSSWKLTVGSSPKKKATVSIKARSRGQRLSDRGFFFAKTRTSVKDQMLQIGDARMRKAHSRKFADCDGYQLGRDPGRRAADLEKQGLRQPRFNYG